MATEKSVGKGNALPPPPPQATPVQMEQWQLKTRRTLVEEWGMFEEEAISSTHGRPAYLCVLLRSSGAFEGILFIDSVTPEAFGTDTTAKKVAADLARDPTCKIFRECRRTNNGIAAIVGSGVKSQLMSLRNSLTSPSYDRIASEYYDAARHPTCHNFGELSERMIASWCNQIPSFRTQILEIGAGRSIIARIMAAADQQLDRLILLDQSKGMLAHSDLWQRLGAKPWLPTRYQLASRKKHLASS